MIQDAFRAGLVPGGLTSSSQIRTLICFLLSNYEKPIPKDILITTLTNSGIVNYFDCVDSINSLIDSELITSIEEELSITDTGIYVTENLSKSLPLTVKERATEAVRQSMIFLYNQQHHNTLIEKIKDGYLVHCSLREPESIIFSLSIYAPTREFAENIKQNFIINAEELIQTIITKMSSADEFEIQT